jgi:tetratricopeptide (TPR) repeat protein
MMKQHDLSTAQKYLDESLSAKKKGDLWEAEKILVEGLDGSPGNPHILTAISELYYRGKRFEEALALSEQVLDSHPKYRGAYVVAGNVLYAQRKFADALVYFQEAEKIDSDRYIISRIVQSLIKLHSFEKAKELVATVLDENPNSITFLRYLVTIYQNSGRDFDARETYKRILTLKRSNERSPLNHPRHREKSQKSGEHMGGIDRLLERNPQRNAIELRLIKADTLYKIGNLTEAVEEYNRVLDSRPDDLYVMRQLGLCYSKLGRYPEAATILEKPFLEEPSDRAIRTATIHAFTEIGEIELLRELLEEGLRRNPQVKSLQGIMKKINILNYRED